MGDIAQIQRQEIAPEDVTHALTSEKLVSEIESKMLDMPQVECSVTHHFGPGIYVREVRIPAGTFSIGHHQNHEHLNVMVQGRVIMLADDGTVQDVRAPQVFVGKPGRKIGLIVEDMIWQNVYATDETDIDKLEATYLTKSDGWLESDEARQKIARVQHQIDRDDYAAMLDELGVAHSTVVAQAENEADQIPFPDTSVQVKVSDSPIEGKGLFALSPFNEGDLIAPARIDGKRTPAGRYTNHSANPNARMANMDGDIYLVAIRSIRGCHGGDPGEEITVDYRQAVETARSAACQA